jgi:uncharacterized protein YecT (DUF1311 family)
MMGNARPRQGARPALRAVLVAALAAAAHGAGAQEGYAAREDCVKRTGQNEIGECMEGKVARSNEDLSDIEGRYRTALEAWDADPQVRDALKAAFELSVEEYRRYRDKQCEFVEAQSGVHDGQLRQGCIVELNALRIDHLDLALRKIA